MTALAGSAFATLTSCSAFAPSSTIRYRMTIRVETPQGLRSGSSVIEVTVTEGRRLGDDSGLRQTVRGEAAAVDMPNGQTLFATLRSKDGGRDYPAYLMHSALKNGVVTPPLSRFYESWDWQAEQAEANKIKPTIELAEIDYPILTRFREKADWRTIEVVNPNDLKTVFGIGIRLNGIFLTVTTDRVTSNIDTKLPDSGPDSGVQQWYKQLPFGDPRQISRDYFEQGT